MIEKATEHDIIEWVERQWPDGPAFECAQMLRRTLIQLASERHRADGAEHWVNELEYRLVTVEGERDSWRDAYHALWNRPVEIRMPGGELDEIVGYGGFHVEQMDDNEWFFDLAGCAFFVDGKKVELRIRDYESWEAAQKHYAAAVENPLPNMGTDMPKVGESESQCPGAIGYDDGTSVRCEYPADHDGVCSFVSDIPGHNE